MQDKLTIVSIKGVRENPSFHVIMSETATSDNDSRYQVELSGLNTKVWTRITWRTFSSFQAKMAVMESL
jgi:hypothetical protein